MTTVTVLCYRLFFYTVCKYSIYTTTQMSIMILKMHVGLEVDKMLT